MDSSYTNSQLQDAKCSSPFTIAITQTPSPSPSPSPSHRHHKITFAICDDHPHPCDRHDHHHRHHITSDEPPIHDGDGQMNHITSDGELQPSDKLETSQTSAGRHPGLWRKVPAPALWRSRRRAALGSASDASEVVLAVCGLCFACVLVVYWWL